MNDEAVTSLDQCRLKLETLFEEKFLPERDFVEFILTKKDKRWEQYYDRSSW